MSGESLRYRASMSWIGIGKISISESSTRSNSSRRLSLASYRSRSIRICRPSIGGLQY